MVEHLPLNAEHLELMVEHLPLNAERLELTLEHLWQTLVSIALTLFGVLTTAIGTWIALRSHHRQVLKDKQQVIHDQQASVDRLIQEKASAARRSMQHSETLSI